MSNRYKGGIISATPPTTTGGESGTASGAWTLEQQMQAQAAGLWPAQPTGPWIEDVFSTWLYTGSNSATTITNGVDLAGKGGMVWIKSRGAETDHYIVDSQRVDGSGDFGMLASNLTSAQSFQIGVSSFNADGFSLDGNVTQANRNGFGPYASWTFREQPKFFDVVTYTGNGANRTIAHNLGSVPGCIIVKRTDTIGAWQVYHRSLSNTQYTVLNTTAAVATGATRWNSTTPTSTEFSLGTDATVNASGGTYVAYLFAHNAGGFGLTGTDNVISCGSYTVESYYATVNLGYEPQWILYKRTDGSTDGDWQIADNMRGLLGSKDSLFAGLQPNLSAAESTSGTTSIQITPTGFVFSGPDTYKYIYIAIRRGPMKTPTTGTSVFSPNLRTTTEPNFVTNFVVDSSIYNYRPGDASVPVWASRLLGGNGEKTSSTAAEVGLFGTEGYAFNTGVGTGNSANSDVLTWNFKRAPGFFDVVCYTGTGVARTVTHNLAAVPELMIVKSRSANSNWEIYNQTLGATKYIRFDNQPADTFSGLWNNTSPTSSVFTVGTFSGVNGSGSTYVAYLFASCPGVSRVGSYTGTGTTQTINCGFTGGARFVMIKRTDSTGDWYVWDSARGMIPANDPYLLLNSTAAEVTGTDFVDTAATGFEITSTAPAAINANGGTFIFLAIA